MGVLALGGSDDEDAAQRQDVLEAQLFEQLLAVAFLVEVVVADDDVELVHACCAHQLGGVADGRNRGGANQRQLLAHPGANADVLVGDENSKSVEHGNSRFPAPGGLALRDRVQPCKELDFTASGAMELLRRLAARLLSPRCVCRGQTAVEVAGGGVDDATIYAVSVGKFVQVVQYRRRRGAASVGAILRHRLKDVSNADDA